jgi:hypothetical protein
MAKLSIQLLVFGDHAICMINTSIPIFGELVDRLQLSLFTFSITKLSSEFTSGNITTACLFGIVHKVDKRLSASKFKFWLWP